MSKEEMVLVLGFSRVTERMECLYIEAIYCDPSQKLKIFQPQDRDHSSSPVSSPRSLFFGPTPGVQNPFCWQVLQECAKSW